MFFRPKIQLRVSTSIEDVDLGSRNAGLGRVSHVYSPEPQCTHIMYLDTLVGGSK